MTATPMPSPTAGWTFRQVRALGRAGQIERAKRLQVLSLIGAFIDAEHPHPSVEELAGRLKLKPKQVYGLIARLEDDGWLVVHRQKKAPRLTFEIVLKGGNP